MDLHVLCVMKVRVADSTPQSLWEENAQGELDIFRLAADRRGSAAGISLLRASPFDVNKFIQADLVAKQLGVKLHHLCPVIREVDE